MLLNVLQKQKRRKVDRGNRFSLHDVVATVGKSLIFKEYTIGILMGAFNNIKTAVMKDCDSSSRY